MITLLTLRGCGEPLTGNMLTGVVRQLDPQRFRHVEIPHPGTLGPAGNGGLLAPSEMETVREGCRLLDQEVANAAKRGERVVIAWYSLGGVIGTEWLNTRKTGRPDLYRRVALAGGIANPRRANGRSYGRPCGGEGIYAADQTHEAAWAEFADPGDPITAMPLDSPLRQGSDLIQWMSLADPIRWALDVIDKLPRVRMQLLGKGPWRLLQPSFWRSFATAAQMMQAYAFQGAHTTVYGEPRWRNWRGQPISALDLLASCVRGVKE